MNGRFSVWSGGPDETLRWGDASWAFGHYRRRRSWPDATGNGDNSPT